jgi:hypothetical protein
MTTTLKTKALIVGGGTGGVAAALALTARGIRCVMTEPTAWVGGQLTSQGVPPDENRWIEGAEGVQSATASYLAFRERVRAYYRAHRPLTDSAAHADHLNPGNGWVSRLCHEPRIGHEVLRAMLAPALAEGLLDLRLHHTPTAAEADGDRIRAVTFLDHETGDTLHIEGEVYLDATETGDLYPLAGVEHFFGADGSNRFGELHARRPEPDPGDQQSFCWCFALEHRPGEDHTTDPPDRYAWWRDYTPDLQPEWTGPLFSWTIPGHDGEPRELPMIPPTPGEEPGNAWELWRYRRIVDPAIVRAEHRPDFPEVSLVNWVQMDYWQKPLLGVDDADRDAALAGAREQSLCFLHWLRTEAPRADGGRGYPGLKLRGDELGTGDGFAMAPYIREPRRLDALQMVTEAHVGSEQRLAEGAPRLDGPVEVGGEPFADSVGIGSYHLDLHPTTGGFSGMYVPSCPFRIPLGALIPKRVTNLIAAGKALGVSHIANGCFRLHPVEWAVGEAAGHAVAQCLASGISPAGLHADPAHVRALQSALSVARVPIAWPWD